MRVHHRYLALALLLTSTVYARLIPSYYCGFDDFINARRAALDDAAEPARIFTTSHFGSAKYRPLSRAVTYVTQMQDWPPVLAHRLRNLACHLVAVAMVYGIAVSLGGTPEVALVAATLFGVHPMSHQTVAAAIFTIDFAYAAGLAALVVFFRAYESARHSTPILVLALMLSTVALLTYEATIVVFAYFAAYVVMRWATGEAPAAGRRRFLVPLALGSAMVLVLFAALRRLFVEGRMPLTPPPTMLVNLALFAGSLSLPVDLLVLSSLWGTPLPGELVRDHAGRLALAVLLVGLALLGISMWSPSGLRARLRRVPWAAVAYVTAAIPLTLAPFLLFSDHPSETYLYAPAAFFAVGVSLVLHGLLPRRFFGAVAGVIILLAATGSWLRTERVRSCGQIAERILAELPLDRWRAGPWRVRLADAPAIPPMHRFGLYGYRGLATIDPREGEWNAIEAALQLATHNREVRAAVVSTDELPAACSDTDFCGWVFADGRVAVAR